MSGGAASDVSEADRLTAFHRPGRAEEANLPPHLRGLVTRLLRIGLGATAIYMIVGMVLLFARGPSSRVVSRWDLQSLGEGLRTADPSAVLFTGVLVLLATPLVRVGLSAGLFARAGDRDFAGITLLVLALLSLSILVGFFI